MHFHLPKPLHGWREFAGEVGIIVLGVLIALGFEQLVEHFRDEARRSEARDNVRAEIAHDLGKLASRQRVEPCVERRIDEIAGYLDAIGRGAAEPRPSWIGRPQVWTMARARWEAATNTGQSRLLKPDEQTQLSAIYEALDEVVIVQREEQMAWAQLRALTEFSPMNAPEQATVVQALQVARLASWRIRVSISQAKQQASALGITPARDALPGPGSTSVCLPMDTPFGEGVRRSGMSDVGEPR
jgi:hypothetical protein